MLFYKQNVDSCYLKSSIKYYQLMFYIQKSWFMLGKRECLLWWPIAVIKKKLSKLKKILQKPEKYLILKKKKKKKIKK